MSLTASTKIFKGIRFRLTLVYSTLFGLFICVFAYLMTNQYLQTARYDFDMSLINYAIDLSDHLVTSEGDVNVAYQVPQAELNKALPFIISQTYYRVRDIHGNVLTESSSKASFKDIPFEPDLALKRDYTHRVFSFTEGDNSFRAVNLKITSNKKEMIVQVATNINSVIERENDFILMTTLMIPFFIISSSFFSFLIAGNALSPIKALTDSANQIAIQNLSLRVPEVNTGDEVEELSKTLNSLLSRLEESFKAQENFVSNASHQLNTPLAIIKGELDVLETKQRSPEEINKFHHSLREEIQRLIELVKNMLLVSRVKSGLAEFVFHPLRLDDLLISTIGRMNKRAKMKKIALRFNMDEELQPSDLEVMGEKQLLDSVFENLIDNAIKYSPESSSIHIEIRKNDGKTVIAIQDEGPGMDEEKFQHMLTHRYSRGSQLPGTGICLPLANKIAGFHNASIIYKRLTPRGSLFLVEFQQLNAHS